MDDLIKALTIFKKCMEDNEADSELRWPTNCNHDVLFVDCHVEWVPEGARAELEELSFIVDEDNDGFISFRFGSC